MTDTPPLRVVAGAAWLLSAAPAVACAQAGAAAIEPAASDTGRLSATVELTAARVHYEEFLPSVFVALAPEVRLDFSRTLVIARGSVARFEETGNLNLQGTMGAGTFSRPRGGLRGELAGFVSFGSHESLGQSGTAQGLVRVHVGEGRIGGWSGLGGGWSSLGGGLGVSTWRGDLGLWGRVAGARATLVVQPTQVGELRYTAVDAALRFARDRFEVGLEGGFRAGDRTVDESRGEQVWAAGDAVYWATDRLAVVAASGRFLADPVTNAIGGRYTSVGLRLGTRRARAVRADDLPRVLLPRRPARTAENGAGASGERLTVSETAVGGIAFRLELPGARTAEVMGDFSDWEPIPLRPAGPGVFELTIALPPGVYRVNLRTDGGEWRVPPELTAVDDGFGGRVGLLVVRR